MADNAVASAQVRRAWVILLLSTVAFLGLVMALAYGAMWIYRHATAAETARLEIVGGSGVLVRSPADADWRLLTAGGSVREGDIISTALGTVVTVTLFDGSRVEIGEDSIVEIDRMRSSRFLNRTKLVVLRLERGTAYVTMAGHGPFQYSEAIVQAGTTRVVMADSQESPGAGAFLVEVIPGEQDDTGSEHVRAAVMHGAVMVNTPVESIQLYGNQQVVASANGPVGAVTAVVRELIANGSFANGLEGWVEFHQQSFSSAGNRPVGSAIDIVSVPSPHGETIAIAMLRMGNYDDAVQAGVRQRIGKTIRHQSSLLLQFDVRISHQEPLGGGADQSQFPLVVKIQYFDSAGMEQEWWHGYYIAASPESRVSRERATRIDADVWQHIVFDLSSLRPLPRQISSIMVYASGQHFQTWVSGLSLTTAEIADDVSLTP